jgi:hypothetical protein
LSTWPLTYGKTATQRSTSAPALLVAGVSRAIDGEADQLVGEELVLHLEGLVAGGLPISQPGRLGVEQIVLPLQA